MAFLLKTTDTLQTASVKQTEKHDTLPEATLEPWGP